MFNKSQKTPPKPMPKQVKTPQKGIQVNKPTYILRKDALQKVKIA